MNGNKTSETNEQTTTEGKKLYEVISTVPYQRGGRVYRDMKITWFVERRSDGKPPVPYEVALGKDHEQIPVPYDGQFGYPEEAVKELFTATEAQALRAYLLAVHNDDTATLEEVNLPLDDRHTLPLSGIPVSGETDFYMLSEERGYSLPFKVWGFFDVRECECVEEIQAA